ncbi:hypothetical protein P154DRAFT_361016 [Amniculicola lignicola CBS 123094]|uniref:Uncharacterized protein n=1 Tax=Amniculicola lignicola CBS 123094 TaxID=1392246 RepID=A0A6A5W1M1_9PLEO|nr:hypothetical protein P154DRAFT_361016 [Amniculicola lignicola CBS 123094]
MHLHPVSAGLPNNVKTMFSPFHPRRHHHSSGMASASQVSLQGILLTIHSIRREISSLATSLRAAEERIARLENTPPGSPSIENGPTLAQTESPPKLEEAIIPNQESRSTEEQSPVGVGSPSSPPHTPIRKRPCEQPPCDIERHLQPINAGISALTEHVLRIEQTLAPKIEQSLTPKLEQTLTPKLEQTLTPKLEQTLTPKSWAAVAKMPPLFTASLTTSSTASAIKETFPFKSRGCQTPSDWGKHERRHRRRTLR